MLTRQDVNFILAHALAFFLGYSGIMAHGVPHVPPILFDWSAINQGLITAGVANLSIGLTNK